MNAPAFVVRARRTGLLCSAVALALTVQACYGADVQPNIVQNPGFESGFNTWSGTWGVDLGVPWAYEGRNLAHASSFFYQDLPTIAGATYMLQFAMAGNPNWGGTINLQTYWGGTLVATTTWNSAGHSYQTGLGWFTTELQVMATSSSTRLQFLNPGAPSQTPFVDAVSVRLVAVPEPGTWPLLGGGLAMLGWVRYRKGRRP